MKGRCRRRFLGPFLRCRWSFYIPFNAVVVQVGRRRLSFAFAVHEVSVSRFLREGCGFRCAKTYKAPFHWAFTNFLKIRSRAACIVEAA